VPVPAKAIEAAVSVSKAFNGATTEVNAPQNPVISAVSTTEVVLELEMVSLIALSAGQIAVVTAETVVDIALVVVPIV